MPKISVITINFNNASGLQKTFESVFSQTFRNLEYIVIDGGSGDESCELISKYQDKIDYWVSEPDNGAYSAMNKGIARATGDYLLFLNSGDYLADETVLEEIIPELSTHGIVYGNLLMKDNANNSWVAGYPADIPFSFFVNGTLPHPASFIKRSLFEKVGLYDERLKICADWKFFMDAIITFQTPYRHINKTIAVFMLDGMSSSKKNEELIIAEKKIVLQRDYFNLYHDYKNAKASRQNNQAHTSFWKRLVSRLSFLKTFLTF